MEIFSGRTRMVQEFSNEPGWLEVVLAGLAQCAIFSKPPQKLKILKTLNFFTISQ